MKKLFYIIGVAFLLGACESILDLEPKNAVTFDHYFRNERDLEALTAQMHSDLRTAFATVTYQENIGMKIDYVKNGDLEKLRSYNANLITSRYSQQKWRFYYNVLNLADLFLDNYKRAEGVTPSRANFYCGQCYFARALCYLRLAQTWGDAVITKGSMYTDKYAKSPATEVIDTAIAAAEKAYRLLPKYSEMRNSANKSLVSKQYGCKGSAAGVLVQLYAWKGTVLGDRKALKTAVQWADKLLEERFRDEVGHYEMAKTPEDVCVNELKRRGNETVFELEISYTDNTVYATFLPATNLIGWPVIRNKNAADITDNAYGIYTGSVNQMYERTDLRREAYFYKPDDADRNIADLAYLYKWRYVLYRESSVGQASFVNYDANRVMIRLADIYLLRAECKAKSGDLAGAKEDLNVIRRRAQATEYPEAHNDVDTRDGLVWAIFRERERELLYEGHRYYDVVRNYYYNPEFLKELSADFPKLTENDVKNGAFYLPVPETAFSYNDLMLQNVYWLSKMK